MGEVYRATDTRLVVYEMVTGKKAFEGKSQASLITAIMGVQPIPITEVQPVSPATLDRTVRRCLEKDPEDRWQTCRDLLFQLKWSTETLPAGTPETPTKITWLKILPVALGVLVAALLIANIAVRDPSPSPEVTRLTLDLSPGQRLTGGHPLERAPFARDLPSNNSFALSPDGRLLVYAAQDDDQQYQLHLRQMNQEQSTPIPGTEGGVLPFFSPDGQSIGFFAATDTGSIELKRIALAGGSPRTVAELERENIGLVEASRGEVSRANHTLLASWTAAESIVLSGERGLFRVPAIGGSLEQLTVADTDRGELAHLFPQMLPGGRAVLFNVWTPDKSQSDADIVIQLLETGERRTLIERGTSARYVESGHIVFARDGRLPAAPFDLSNLEVTGEPVMVIEDVMQAQGSPASGLNSGIAQFSVSSTGSLAYVPGGTSPLTENSLVWVDQSGNPEPLPSPPGNHNGLRLSPDGTKLAFRLNQDGDTQVWILDLESGIPKPLTSEGVNREPVWSPDGKRLVFASDVEGVPHLFSIAADGTGEIQRLTSSDGP